MRASALLLGLATTAAFAAPASATFGRATEFRVLQLQQAQVAPVQTPRGWLGINVSMDSEAPVSRAIRVIQLYEGGPAYAAGLRVGDIIVEVNGVEATPERFRAAVEGLRPGGPISFTARRAASEVAVSIVAGAPLEQSVYLPHVVARQLDSARAVFETRVQRVEAGGGARGVFFSAPSDSTITVTVESVPGSASTLTSGTVTGTRWRMRSEDGEATFDVTFDFSSGFEGTPLAALVRTDSAQSVLLRERVGELRQEISGMSTDLAEERALRETELARVQELQRRLVEQQRSAERVAGREDLRLVDVLGDAVVIGSNQAGQTVTVRRPLAPYLTGLNRVAGAELRPIDPSLGSYFQTERGLLVIEVVDGSPAAEAGLLAGDVVLSVDGAQVESVDELRKRIAVSPDAWTLTVTRRGRTLELRSR